MIGCEIRLLHFTLGFKSFENFSSILHESSSFNLSKKSKAYLSLYIFIVSNEKVCPHKCHGQRIWQKWKWVGGYITPAFSGPACSGGMHSNSSRSRKSCVPKKGGSGALWPKRMTGARPAHWHSLAVGS